MKTTGIRQSIVFLYGAIALASVTATFAQEQPIGEPDQSAAEVDIDGLIENLDAEDYDIREEATQALIEQGETVRERLEKLAADPPSPEVKVRLQKIFRGIELAELRRNAVKLESLFELVRRANDDDLDKEKLEPLLVQLGRVIGAATDEGDWELPVTFDSLNDEEPATSVQGALVVMRRGKITSLHDSIVLADVAVDVTSARNSIIIARGAVNVSSPRNCLIIAGFDVRVSSVQDSVVLSGRDLSASIARDSVFAAPKPISISIAERSTLINSELTRKPSREAPKMVKTEGFIFPPEEKDNPLAEKIEVTYASGDVVLYRRTEGGGELVARLDKPIEHPDGGAIGELAGWQACYTGHSRYAIFSDGERIVSLPVVAP